MTHHIRYIFDVRGTIPFACQRRLQPKRQKEFSLINFKDIISINVYKMLINKMLI